MMHLRLKQGNKEIGRTPVSERPHVNIWFDQLRLNNAGQDDWLNFVVDFLAAKPFTQIQILSYTC